jgi:predicted dehydrogenase
MERLRVGLLGYGFIGKLHANAVSGSADCELAGVWTLPDKTQEEFRGKYPAGRCYGSPEEMAADPTVQAVVIGLPNRFHHAETLRFLEAGKHVLVEKPMAMSVAEAEEMAALASDRKLTLMVGHMWRFDREFLAVREVVSSGRLGEIIKTKGYGIHESWGPAGWFARKELAGGGALVDMGVHAIDSVRFLLGDPDPVSVYAVIGTHYGDYDVDDTAILMIRWSNGTTSLIESGWWQPHMDGPEASTQLFGRKGYARVFPTMAKFGPGEKPWLPKFPPREEHCDQHIYDGQMAAFARAVRERRNPVPGSAEGLVVMRICEAAYRSAAEGGVVRLP